MIEQLALAPKRFARFGPVPRPPAERFWEKVNKDGPPPLFRPALGPCWLWTAALDRHGYGRWSVGPPEYRRTGAHRFAYELMVGPIAEGLHIDHLCRVPACVNPGNFEAITQAENTRRGLVSALRTPRTTCRAGHELVLVARQCKECKRIYDRERYAARKPAQK